jgi:hypothetical protein
VSYLLQDAQNLRYQAFSAGVFDAHHEENTGAICRRSSLLINHTSFLVYAAFSSSFATVKLSVNAALEYTLYPLSV